MVQQVDLYSVPNCQIIYAQNLRSVIQILEEVLGLGPFEFGDLSESAHPVYPSSDT